MGRKSEPGILFYQMNCDHISNRKIKLLFNDHGADGYWIWQCILSYSYKTKGYYFDFSDSDDLVLFANDYCKKEAGIVLRVIESCIARGLFDQKLSYKYSILTSDRMQEMYLYATSERRRKGTTIDLIQEYLLIPISPEIKNISIGKIGDIPRNNQSAPRNNSPNVTDEEEKYKSLEKAYAALNKDKVSIIKFIREQSPAFIEPYVDIWNIFATEYRKARVQVITKTRKTHFNQRIKEKEFRFMDLLSKAKVSRLCMESNWFDFDFLIKNRDGYVKLLEGKYDNAAEHHPAPAANSTDSKLKELLEHAG